MAGITTAVMNAMAFVCLGNIDKDRAPTVDYVAFAPSLPGNTWMLGWHPLNEVQ